MYSVFLWKAERNSVIYSKIMLWNVINLSVNIVRKHMAENYTVLLWMPA